MNPDEPEADPRLASVYDAENRWGPDDDFFLDLVNRRPRSRVLDLGCGTGRLTIALAAAGHTVTGVDPNPGALGAARVKPRADRVTWIEGTSACVDSGSFDISVMTSHVAQVFVTDEAWTDALADLRRALVPGGLLAFDTRDPRRAAWAQWTPEATHDSFDLPDGDRVEAWVDVRSVTDGVVTFAWANVFSDGTAVEGVSALRFRSEQVIRRSLEDAGFRIEETYGGWRGQPVGATGGEIIVVARSEARKAP